MRKRVVGIIPARYGSTRLPAKPLLLVKGKYLIEHVYRQVKKSKKLDDVIIATDDIRIVTAARKFGAKVALTSKSCSSGTDRLAEVAKKIEKKADVLINIQGDEPKISPVLIDKLASELLRDSDLDMVTAAYPIKNSAELDDPNVVKVVLNKNSNALYFSRYCIPFKREDAVKTSSKLWLKHLGIYGYRRKFLLKYSSWKQTPLEKIEKLEQLRVLENGHKIKVIISRKDSFGVDTPEDVKRIGKII
ncbi:MAG: 3-deoxy-manno-octulosonate cytidylyltransferase [Endomicrobiales bacterium]|nr:3-deoxy-manno-octulosonate cytidylyltransferase [Endomicrobiales bacterium]